MSNLPRINSTRSANNDMDNSNELSTNESKSKIVLPSICATQENDIIRNPLVINNKITQLETKLLTLEQNYEFVLNKITQDEVKINYLERKQNSLNINQDINNKKNGMDPEIDSIIGREVGVLNNKIKYLEQMIRNETEKNITEKQKEMDFNKLLLNKINTSLTNTIQMEVEQRFKGDLMQKNLSIKEIDGLQRQINSIKTQSEQINENLIKKIEDNNNECSERNQNLAKYVDLRLEDAKYTKETKELKKFIERLTEQIKNNMSNQNARNEYFEQKIKNAEERWKKSIDEMYAFLTKIEKRLVNKIMYLKNYFEINTLNNNKIIEANIKGITNNLEKNMQFLSGEIAAINSNASLEFQNINKNMKFHNKAVLADLEGLVTHQTQLENIMINRFKELEQINENFYKRIALFESKLDIGLTNEKILRNCENKNIKKEIADISGSISDTNEVVFTDLNKLMTENKIKDKKMKEKLDVMEKIMYKNKECISLIEVDLNETLTKVILNEITQIAVEEKMTGEINRIKLYETNISNNREDIIKLNDRIVEAFKSLGGISKKGEKINDMIREKEMRDDVEKLMEKMLDACAIEEVKDESMNKINSLSNRVKENKEKEEKRAEEIKQEIKEMNNRNEEKINEIINIISDNITDSNIHKSMFEMFTNAEIDNLYEIINDLSRKQKENEGKNSKIDSEVIEQIIKQIDENNEVTKKALANYSDIIDNKVNKSLEKIKQDNIEMWENSIVLSQKMNSPEEIKKLIREVPPIIMPLDETLQKIMNLTFKYQNPKPFIPDLYANEKQIDEENFGKFILDKNEKEGEPDKSTDNSKNTKNSKNSKKSKISKK